MEFITEIQYHWQFVALLVWMFGSAIVRVVRDFICKNRNCDGLERLTAEMAELKKQLRGQKIILMLAITSPNCSTARFEIIKSTYENYKRDGLNGDVSNHYIEWCERRDKSQNNLKQNRK